MILWVNWVVLLFVSSGLSHEQFIGWVLGSDGTTEMVVSLSIWSFFVGFYQTAVSGQHCRRKNAEVARLLEAWTPELTHMVFTTFCRSHIARLKVYSWRWGNTRHLLLEGAAKTFVTIPPWNLHLWNTQRKQSSCRNWEGKARKVKEEPWRVKSRSQAMDCCKNGRQWSQYIMLWSGRVRSVPKMAIGFGS